MINIEDLKAKTEAFIEAFGRLQEEVKDEENPNVPWYETPIDEDYILIFERSAIAGLIVAIVDQDYTPLFYYLPDEDFTIGDVLGGYLDLYFKR